MSKTENDYNDHFRNWIKHSTEKSLEWAKYFSTKYKNWRSFAYKPREAIIDEEEVEETNDSEVTKLI